jgi:U3 small nucleolar RNA-associated protein 5
MALLPSGSKGLLAVLHNPRAPGNQSSLQLVSVPPGESVTVPWPRPAEDKDDKETTLGRRRPNDSMTVLGPGQAGTESTNVSEGPRKRTKLSSSDENDQDDAMEDEEGGDDVAESDQEDPDTDPSFGMSIADRLKQLTQVLEEEDAMADRMEADFNRFAPDGSIITHKEHFSKTATTDSLSELLTQALRGGNDDLLELGLAVQDRHVLQESIQDLDDHCLNVLLTKLTTRLARRPHRASEMIAWFTAILSSGRIHEPGQLLPLKNLVQERVSTFPQMLQLEGRVNTIKCLKSSPM